MNPSSGPKPQQFSGLGDVAGVPKAAPGGIPNSLGGGPLGFGFPPGDLYNLPPFGLQQNQQPFFGGAKH
jgi:hypothetical protein